MNWTPVVRAKRAVLQVGKLVRGVGMPRGFLAVVAVVVILGLILLLWKVPQWQLASWQSQLRPADSTLTIKDFAQVENEFRATWAQIVGGMVLLLGLYFTWRNLIVSQEGQITERFTRAIEQLDHAKALELRLGAIYALERVARDSEKDHWPVMEVLTAYVRAHASWSSPPKGQREAPPLERPQAIGEIRQRVHPASDIQAVLTVLGRRTRTYKNGEANRLDLSGTDLRGAKLVGAHLEGAGFPDAHLEEADLMEAHLEGQISQELT
jgi:Pentapeptide repeats (8 copies)